MYIYVFWYHLKRTCTYLPDFRQEIPCENDYSLWFLYMLIYCILYIVNYTVRMYLSRIFERKIKKVRSKKNLKRKRAWSLKSRDRTLILIELQYLCRMYSNNSYNHIIITIILTNIYNGGNSSDSMLGNIHVKWTVTNLFRYFRFILKFTYMFAYIHSDIKMVR